MKAPKVAKDPKPAVPPKSGEHGQKPPTDAKPIPQHKQLAGA